MRTKHHPQNKFVLLTHNPSTTPQSSGKRIRPYETVKPLADDLGLTIDHHCDRDDSDCAVDSISSFINNQASSSSVGVLLCWEHDALSDISKGLGDEFNYPDDHFDLIYDIVDGDLTSNSPYSEHCSGLDS